jgi:hypothetical protein
MNIEEQSSLIIGLMAYVYTEVCMDKIRNRHKNFGNFYENLIEKSTFDWCNDFYEEVKNEVNFIKLQELCEQVFNLAGLPKGSISHKNIVNLVNMTTSDIVEHWEFLFDDVDLIMSSFITVLCDHYKGSKTAVTPEMVEWLKNYINDKE